MNDTRVVCVKVTNIRIHRDKTYNLKDWMAEPGNLYIGRKGIVFVDGRRWPPADSLWANPFKITAMSDREDVLAKYEVYVRERLARGELDIEEIRGKMLGCWCKPERCHGDVLVRLLSER